MTRLAIAMVLVSLGGCIQAPVAGDAWTSRAACDLQYPDGSRVDCVDQSARAMLSPNVPPGAGWLCQDGNAGYRSYENALDGRAFGVSYPQVGLDGVVHGLLLAEEGQQTIALYSWDALDGRQFVSGTRAASSDGAAIVLYNASVVSAPARLVGIEPTFIWSIWDGKPWLVWEFATPSATYWFQSMTTTPFGHLPDNLNVTVAGETLEVMLFHTGGYAWGSPAVDPQCTALGPS